MLASSPAPMCCIAQKQQKAHAHREVVSIRRSVIFESTNMEGKPHPRGRVGMDEYQPAWYNDETGECYHRGGLHWQKDTGRLEGDPSTRVQQGMPNEYVFPDRSEKRNGPEKRLAPGRPAADLPSWELNQNIGMCFPGRSG